MCKSNNNIQQQKTHKVIVRFKFKIRKTVLYMNEKWVERLFSV